MSNVLHRGDAQATHVVGTPLLTARRTSEFGVMVNL